MQYVVVFLTEIDFNLLAYDISGPQYYFFNSTEIIHVLNINSILLFLSLWTLCVAIQIHRKVILYYESTLCVI